MQANSKFPKLVYNLRRALTSIEVELSAKYPDEINWDFATEQAKILDKNLKSFWLLFHEMKKGAKDA
jgi:hypothetical protein